MNIVLWVLQIVLALHTLMGAIWKFSNPEQAAGSLGAIPHGVWISLSFIEIVCALLLVLPLVYKRASRAAPIGAICIAVEMLVFCGVHLGSGDANYGPMIYWLVVALLCCFIAYGRIFASPLNK